MKPRNCFSSSFIKTPALHLVEAARRHWLLLLTLVALAGGACGRLQADVGLAGIAITDPLASDGSGLTGGRLVLLVVDRSRDGFAAANAGVLKQGDTLSAFVGNPDDVVVGSLSSSIVFGRSAIPGNATISLVDGIDAGDPFAVIFFDQLAAGSATINVATSYAVATDPSWVLPADGHFVQYLASGGDGTVEQLSAKQTSLVVGGTSFAEGSYLAWAQSQFGDAMLPIAQSGANSDGDLFTNLFEYAFGMNPLASSDAGAPLIQFDLNESGGTLSIDYTRPVGNTDVAIGIEVSIDLLVWDRDPSGLQEVLHEVSDGVEHRRFSMMLVPGGYRFARLVVLEGMSVD